MDFAKLDLRAASERGSWVTLRHPRIPEGESPKLRIKGMGAKGVMDAFRRVERVQALKGERMARTSDRDADGVLAKFQDELEQAMAALVVASVAEWDGIEWDGVALELTADNILKVCGPGTLFFGQVNSAIAEEHRLFTEADSAS
jgi:hypothetical protein